MSWIDYWAHRNLFSDVETLALFVGYPRTGHTLLSALINAHPSAMISNELKASRYLRLGFSRHQIFALIRRNERRFRSLGYTQGQTGYRYEVPGSAQGSETSVTLIGDKCAETTSEEALRNPDLFDTIRQRLDGRELRIIHHVRNPYDSIATIARRQGLPLARGLKKYRKLVGAVEQSRPSLASDEFLTTYHEDLVADPKAELTRVCEFLGLEAEPTYLDACAGLVFDKPQRSRHLIEWADDEVAAVADLCRQTDFLQRYADEGV